ncbi:unnamed protein product [Macrosiphum euphorbiae]|uniref:Retrotransposon gag domain-containing protein n=1 Tax=Macrosiphum euphorbiae TaxID=13131 RepID=A0AAV0YBR0_9HEMI|nr:unnamed protein product [Macrosiphum euphorbiae]
MYSAGKRDTHPPDRLIDRLLQPDTPPMPPTTTMSETPNKNVTTVSQAGMATGNVHPQPTKVEPTLADLIAIMNGHASDQAQRFDRLENQFSGFTKRQDAVELRVDKTEKNIATLHRNSIDQRTAYTKSDESVAKIHVDVESLKETVKQIQSDLKVLSIHSTSQAQSFQPISNSTEAHINSRQLPNSYGQSFVSASVSQSERFTDAVSEFTGRRQDVHPEKFLNQLDQYFLYNCPHDDQRVELFQRRLTSGSRVWFDSLMPVPTTYEEVKKLFRQQFWSAATQRKIRNEIFQPCQYRSPVGINTHAMTWIAKAKYLSPPIDQFDLVGIIIQHYPSTLGMAIRGRGPQTTNALLSVLTEIEESTSFCEAPGSRQSDHGPTQSARNHDQPPRDPQERRGYQPRNNNRNNYRNGPNRGPQNDHRPPARDEEPIHQLNASGNEPQSRQ